MSISPTVRRAAPPRPPRGIILLALLVLLGAIAYSGWFVYSIVRTVPPIDAVLDYQPKIPLRIYTADQVLIGEFGIERREFVPIARMPDLMKKAVLAIEDTRFYEHGGIDWIRAMGAARANLKGGFREGASTITMQVARTFFLTREKLVSRKITEIALAYKIEAALSKDQILELYMNQIFLGQRAYGFAGAARAYFGKDLNQLSIAEIAMLAGLPQNPARHNPAVNPKRAAQRQRAVLKRMWELGYITEDQYNEALGERLRVRARSQEFPTHGEYVAELARQAVYEQFQDDAYTRGIRVTTTIRSKDQDAAYESVRRNVLAYDQRHGYRGPEAFIDLPADQEERDLAVDTALQQRPSSDGLVPAVVLSVAGGRVRVETRDGETLDIGAPGLRFVAAALSAKAKPSIRLRPGAIVRVTREGKRWSIVQVPQVAAAFVAIDASTGAYRALVGGFDYNLQKFNHVTQAWRQPGSAIKPFVYSAALEKGYSPGTLILDEALDLPGENAGATWSPQNDDGQFDGVVAMREALAQSKNVPTVRLLRAVSVSHAHQFLGRFGFDPTRHPKNLTMSLGTGAVTPLQMAGAYAVFANGGYAVQPYLISRIEDLRGNVIARSERPATPPESQRVIDQRNAFVVDSMLRGVTRHGTGAAAGARLGRADIAGKTGTTSDAIDGWFAGYGANVVAVAWMGYDEPRSLGGREFGATLSLPIWIDYMKVALAGVPERERTVPEGLTEDGGDLMYSEYAGTTEFKTIDVTPLPEPGTGDDGADDGATQPEPPISTW